MPITYANDTIFEDECSHCKDQDCNRCKQMEDDPTLFVDDEIEEDLFETLAEALRPEND